jgi:hypothetical protein
MERRSYLVRLVRPVFEVAVVEVEAEDEQMAAVAALHSAESIGDVHWVGKFDADSYACDAQYVIAAEEAEDDDYIFSGIEDERKYLLLKADLDAGEGQVTFQPWMDSVDDLMSADLCMDWGDQIEALRREGADRYFGWLAKSLESPKAAGLAKVIPFRRPEKDKERE